MKFSRNAIYLSVEIRGGDGGDGGRRRWRNQIIGRIQHLCGRERRLEDWGEKVRKRLRIVGCREEVGFVDVIMTFFFFFSYINYNKGLGFYTTLKIQL